MLRINRLLTILVLLALLVSACQPIVAPVTTPAPDVDVVPATGQGLRPDAPVYALRGPYVVGVRNFARQAVNEAERPLNVTVWYPALNPEGLPESYRYTMDFAAGEMPLFAVNGYALENAAPATPTGPYPLVVHTHGFWSFRQELPYLAEHLASHGFVIMATDHEDNWGTTWNPKPWQSEFRRSDEIRRQIDFAETLSAANGDLAGLIDTEHVAVTGWSYGGETALLQAGARLDPAQFRAWCEANQENGEYTDTDCTSILDHLDELAELAGLDAVPTGLWPAWRDPRVDVAVALAPWVGMIGPDGLQTVDRPVLTIIGTGDTDVGPAYRRLAAYTQLGTADKSEVLFAAANHFLFFDSCRAAPDLIDMGMYGLCADSVWEMDRAHDLINHFTTAFLLAELKGDADAAAALAPENVVFPGIQYETTGFDK